MKSADVTGCKRVNTGIGAALHFIIGFSARRLK